MNDKSRASAPFECRIFEFNWKDFERLSDQKVKGSEGSSFWGICCSKIFSFAARAISVDDWFALVNDLKFHRLLEILLKLKFSNLFIKINIRD